MHQVLLRDGRLAWVNDEGKIVRISSGMGGAEPGFGETPQSNLPPQGVYHPDARTRDLMSRLPDADIVGLRGPGVVPGGEQSAGARHREIAQAAQPPPALTYRPLAGSQVNNRGNIQRATVKGDGGPAQTVASIVETPKDCGADAEVITVQLGLGISPNDVVNLIGVDFNVTAIVEWGVGNSFFSAEVDWSLGTTFSICASFIRISAMIGATPVGAGQPDTEIILSASLSYGNAMSVSISSEARKSVPMADLPLRTLAAGATSALFAIPSWALGLTLTDAGILGPAPFFPVLNSIPSYEILLSDGANVVARYTLDSRSNVSGQVEGQFPVPSRARFIRITNLLGQTVVNPTAIFNLGL